MYCGHIYSYLFALPIISHGDYFSSNLIYTE